MVVNMASWDRIVRLIVAVVFILLSAFVLHFNAHGHRSGRAGSGVA